MISRPTLPPSSLPVWSARPSHASLLLVLLVLLLLAQLPAAWPALPPAPSIPSAQSLLAQADRPLAFMPADTDAAHAQQFQASGLGGTLSFSATGVDLQPGSAGASGFALRFVNAAPTVTLRPGDRLPGVVHLLTGNDSAAWRTHVPTFAVLDYQALYPGIDLRYDGTVAAFKGTYTVATGADPQQIRWRYAGAGTLTVDPAGNLHIPTADGTTLIEQAPVAWQERGERREPVAVRYDLATDGSVGFALGAYDRAAALTIDPVLSYSTYVGGEGSESGQGIAVQATTGSAYLVGTTSAAPFAANTGTQAGPLGGTDVFVSKLDPTGTTVLYTTYLGGSGDDSGAAIALDSTGAAYLSGTTQSSDFPMTTGSVAGGVRDAFVVKLAADGTFSYGKYLGAEANDYGYGIAVDLTGNAYVVGRTDSTRFPVLAAFQATSGGKGDAFLTKLDPVGAVVYSTYLGGSGGDYSTAVAVDSANAAYVTGYTDSVDFRVKSGAFRPLLSGRADAFVTKFNSVAAPLTLAYSTYLGGTQIDYGNAIAVDSTGAAYLTGITSSTDFPTQSVPGTALSGGPDAFVTKLNPNGGTLAYSRFLGGESGDSGHGIAVDSAKNAYVTGTTSSVGFPRDEDPATFSGGTDAFVTQLSSTGTTLYSAYLGGTNADSGAGIAIRAIGAATTAAELYVTGQTSSSDLPFVNDMASTYHGGTSDAFVMKLALTNQPRLFLKSAATVVGLEQTFDVDLQVNPSSKPIDTIEAHLRFDPSYLEVVSVTPKTPFFPGDEDGANASYTFDIPGQLDFLAWTPQTFATEETAATIRFKAKQSTEAVGVTRITLARAGVYQSDLLRAGNTIAPILSGGTVRILPGALLKGKVSLEQRGPSNTANWITNLSRTTNQVTQGGITLYTPGSSTPLDPFSATTDRQGAFAVSLNNFPGGAYDISVKGDTTLSELRKSVLLSDTSTFPITFDNLQIGDSTGDDQINGADASYLVPSFGRRSTDAAFRPYGDINKDGVVDSIDANALVANFLESGEAPRSGAAMRSRVRSPQSATGSVPVLSFSPAERVVLPGDVFTMTLMLDVPSTPADTVDVYMNLDTNFLQLVGEDGLPVSQVALDPAVKDHATYNVVQDPDNKIQRISLSITRFTGPFFIGRVPIATLHFRAIGPTPPPPHELKLLNLLRGGVRQSDVLSGGASLQPTLGTGTVKILGLYRGYVFYLPSVER